jgi:hypothetical protein
MDCTNVILFLVVDCTNVILFLVVAESGGRFAAGPVLGFGYFAGSTNL